MAVINNTLCFPNITNVSLFEDLLQNPVDKWENFTNGNSCLQHGDLLPGDHDNHENDVISDSYQFYISLVLTVIIIPVFSVLGVVSNIIDMIIFVKQGLKDCMAASLFSLAFAELHQCTWVLIWCVGFAGTLFFPKNPHLDFDVLILLTTNIVTYFKAVAVSLTVFISLERCLCVVWPLKFRRMFTLKKSAWVITFVYILNFLPKLPFFFFFHFSQQYDPKINITRLGYVISDTGLEIENITSSINLVITSIGSQIVVVIATIVTNLALKRSINFRKMMTSVLTKESPALPNVISRKYEDTQSSSVGDKPIQDYGIKQKGDKLQHRNGKQRLENAHEIGMDMKNNAGKGSGMKSTEENSSETSQQNNTHDRAETTQNHTANHLKLHRSTPKDVSIPKHKTTTFQHCTAATKPASLPVSFEDSTTKDVRLTKMIVILATMFASLRLPEVVGALVKVSLQGLHLSQEHRNVYSSVGAIIVLCQVIYANINVFIYYNMNSQYRSCFRRLFRLN